MGQTHFRYLYETLVDSTVPLSCKYMTCDHVHPLTEEQTTDDTLRTKRLTLLWNIQGTKHPGYEMTCIR